MKTYDVFIFNNEIDLLNIRLEYLSDLVDFFIIIEAPETFSGISKELNFPKNITKFSKYKNKILYANIAVPIKCFDDLELELPKNGLVGNRVLSDLQLLLSDEEANLTHWVRDAYHREVCKIAMDKYCHPGDFIIFGDLDEIPFRSSLIKYKEMNVKSPLKKVIFPRMLDFEFAVNRLRGNNWMGSCFASFEVINMLCLNSIRATACYRRESDWVRIDEKLGGYHFSSVGSLSLLKNKIKSYGHQEFNIFPVVQFLEVNLNCGRDIFYRKGMSTQFTDIKDTEIYDEKMRHILQTNYQNFFFYPRNTSLYRICSLIGLVLNIGYKALRKFRELKNALF